MNFTSHMTAGNQIINSKASAQCYPRHACPLYASLFMQVHDAGRAAPGAT
jgi:hypothetical protein